MNEIDIANKLAWNDDRRLLAYQQHRLAIDGHYGGQIDGLFGPSTDAALQAFEDLLLGRPAFVRSDDRGHLRNLDDRFGAPGENIVTVDVPFPLRLAWDTDISVQRVSVNAAVSATLVEALQEALAVYGYHQIVQLGLNLYGGGYNKRKKRGGTSWSTHAYGIAIDIDPMHNRMRWKTSGPAGQQPRLAGPEYDVFHEIMERHGWQSLGRKRDFDWMHFECV